MPPRARETDLYRCCLLSPYPAKFIALFGAQYLYSTSKWLINQAMANWVTTNIVLKYPPAVESIFSFVGDETVNYNLSKCDFGNVL